MCTTSGLAQKLLSANFKRCETLERDGKNAIPLKKPKKEEEDRHHFRKKTRLENGDWDFDIFGLFLLVYQVTKFLRMPRQSGQVNKFRIETSYKYESYGSLQHQIVPEIGARNQKLHL